MKRSHSSSLIVLSLLAAGSGSFVGCATVGDDPSGASTGGGGGTPGMGTGGTLTGTGGGSATGGGTATGGTSTTGGASSTGGTSPVTCEAEETECSGSCVTLGTETHCAECDDSCVTGSSCVLGDAGPACACATESETLCPTGCFDVMSSAANCGDCGQDCGENATGCSAGECVCESGFATCSGEIGCFDTDSDPTHCGASCETCAATDICSSGSCVCNDAAEGVEDCGGECISTDADADNCGGCGTTCGVSCVAGSCSATEITGTQDSDTAVQIFAASAEGDYSVTPVDTTCARVSGTLGCNGGENFQVVLVVDDVETIISGSYYASGVVPVLDSSSDVRLKVTGDVATLSCTLGCY